MLAFGSLICLINCTKHYEALIGLKLCVANMFLIHLFCLFTVITEPPYIWSPELAFVPVEVGLVIIHKWHGHLGIPVGWEVEARAPGSDSNTMSSCLVGYVPCCAQSYLALWDFMDCSLPGFSVHGISRPQYWSRSPCLPPGDLPGPGIKHTSPASPALQTDSLPTEPPGKPTYSSTAVLITLPHP